MTAQVGLIREYGFVNKAGAASPQYVIADFADDRYVAQIA